MPIKENLSLALREYKKSHGLSLERLAMHLGLSKNSTESCCKGTANPRADTLELISRQTNIPLAEIVSGPLPGKEQTETTVQAARFFACLPPEEQERGIQLFLELVALFSGGELK